MKTEIPVSRHVAGNNSEIFTRSVSSSIDSFLPTATSSLLKQCALEPPCSATLVNV